MDQLNMNNIKHHEKINTHTQNNKEKHYTKIWPTICFSKRQYVRPPLSLSPENRGRERVEKGGRERVHWKRVG